MSVASQVHSDALDQLASLQTHVANTQDPQHGFANTPLNDGHLNKRGHQVVARVMSAAMCDALRFEKES